MTYECAVYYKLLLLCGYKDDLEQYLDASLVEQNPLSGVVLELFSARCDDKKKLSALNEYLRQGNDSDIDYDKSVFHHVMSFLRRKYTDDDMSMKDITDLMYQIAIQTERYFDEPWNTMCLMGILYGEAEEGYIDKDDYQRKFDAFLNDNICFCDYPPENPPEPPKESLFKRLIKRIRGNC